MSRDQKVMMLLPPTEKSPISIKELFLLPKFDNSSSSVLEIKRFVKVMWLWGNGMVPLPPEAVPNGTLWMRFSCCPNFQTVNFADFKQFKIVSYFADIGEVKIGLNCLYLQVSVIIMTFGREKQSKLSPFDKKKKKIKNQA